MTDIWDEKPPIPNSRDKKYSRTVDDWRVSATPSEHFKSVEYMRDLREWKEKHDVWLDKVGHFIGNLENDIAELKAKVDDLDKENEERLEKAENWDELQDHPHFADMTIERILEESEFNVKRMNIRGAQNEAIKTLKNEIDKQIDFVKRASRTHGLIEEQKVLHEYRKYISEKLMKILEGDSVEI